MVERWQPEAQTFHLCTGEATITLQDVEVMYGLQVDGRPLYIEEPQPPPSYREELTRLTDYVPGEGEIWVQIRMSMVALCTRLRLLDIEHPITDGKTQVDVNRSDRLYLLIIFGSILFPNISGSHVSLKYLLFLEDLGELGCYIWGATVLAYLYRSLCQASTGDKRDVSGFQLLQIWVWSRMRPFQPVAAQPQPDFIAEGMPFAWRWTGGIIQDVDTHHRLLPFRDQLDRMTTDMFFIWRPYDKILDQLLAFCRLHLMGVDCTKITQRRKSLADRDTSNAGKRLGKCKRPTPVPEEAP
ncbi:protein MAINTENANCE OF MERISTEMS-like [Lycium ferocissimum]|uniref:protein MAINTENANCE OF MERISTEMS-like n=1 Tax=Lycium ferocissimum TaxID=112874 RepID=UPI0028158442|nr:protein MAINTENANCE OF MERISTEMS-like [Lycium ferocissimum]